ncbi:MAG: nucleoside-diphosphate sugar epimerase/dehydratase [Clostridiales bacterium]|nr:nucleoside-diphosphate sugar epimerase/dehydratase [Clostridiales bacterium]
MDKIKDSDRRKQNREKWSKGKKFWENHKRAWLIMLVDMMIVVMSSVLAIYLRFDFSFSNIEPIFWKSVCTSIPLNIVVTIFVFVAFKLYSNLWRFASFKELFDIVTACMLATCMGMLLRNIFCGPVPKSYSLLYLFFLTLLVVISRFGYRIVHMWLHGKRVASASQSICTMIVGAGTAGDMIIRELKNSKHLVRNVACVIDDNPVKIGSFIHGVKVVGDRYTIPAMAEYYGIQEIIVAIPTMEPKDRKEILNICQQTGCKVKALPGIYQMVTGDVNMTMLKPIEIEDLLGRDPIRTDIASVMDYVENRVVLVTGGGGSIGSELCRQIASYHPRQLIILDIYENNAYDLQMELNRKIPELNMEVLIASVRDKIRIESIFNEYHPDIVFHAAAHKHVPLMEKSPNEAIKNNVVGTFNVAQAANKYHVKKMILISTDKAVRPTNIMGASKRICEMIIQEFSQKSRTEYAAVRFGNVLGSNGSVIPLFRKQIEAGGPVTITHPDITRFFMTIPEAVSLVLQAGAFARGGEIFILDMGEPVRILDMAEKMIRLSGKVPNEDIEIQFVGLRPGEKLYEELLIDDKHLISTTNEKIFICMQEAVDMEALKTKMKILYQAASDESTDIRSLVRDIVPEYREASVVNREAEAAKQRN